ncbi:MAG: UDP-3-O-(3-hydroxymyristoyl)glucosamine N-acyltransferase [Acutalibacteraceae bacterium]
MNNAFVTAKELAEHLEGNVLGDKDKKIYSIALMRDSAEESLTYVPSKSIDDIVNIKAGVILTKVSIGLPLHRTYIVTRHEPYMLLAKTINFLINKGLYCTPNSSLPIIADNADIAHNATIGNGTAIGNMTIISPGVVIGENVIIGSGCLIGANTVIGSNTVIEDNVSIGSCCSIGTENFEYCKENRNWSKIPAIGNVYIHDNVIIGGNVVIEKGTIGTTVIGAYTQICSLVHIAHEARVGINCHIVSGTALAGWSEIGNNVDVYAQSGVSNYVKVGDNAVLMARSVADKSIKENTVVSGFPAREHTKEMRFQAFLRMLFRKSTKGCELK